MEFDESIDFSRYKTFKWQKSRSCFLRLGSGAKRETELAPAGVCGRGTRRVTVSYAEGTLIIDLRDASNGNLVWRAVSVDTASSELRLRPAVEVMPRPALRQRSL